MESHLHLKLYSLSKCFRFLIPDNLSTILLAAQTPKEIEDAISELESELAGLVDKLDEFLICDTATELMLDLLMLRGIDHEVICGYNDYGDSHSYIRVDAELYDPTYQGFGDKQFYSLTVKRKQ